MLFVSAIQHTRVSRLPDGICAMACVKEIKLTIVDVNTDDVLKDVNTDDVLKDVNIHDVLKVVNIHDLIVDVNTHVDLDFAFALPFALAFGRWASVSSSSRGLRRLAAGVAVGRQSCFAPQCVTFASKVSHSDFFQRLWHLNCIWFFTCQHALEARDQILRFLSEGIDIEQKGGHVFLVFFGLSARISRDDDDFIVHILVLTELAFNVVLQRSNFGFHPL